jgi:hypothetical protein
MTPNAASRQGEGSSQTLITITCESETGRHFSTTATTYVLRVAVKEKGQGQEEERRESYGRTHIIY